MDYLPHLQILWDYLCLHRPPETADVIVGFGCYDDNVARRAAQLYHQGYGRWVLFTGGLGRNTTGLFFRSEAEVFAQVAMELGVPEEAILLEDRSTNTKENIHFTKALLQRRGIPHHRILGVHKPYMERRIQAAMGVYWPEQIFSVTSATMSLEEALQDAQRQGMSVSDIISTIVGDLQRIDLYPKLGYQLPQFIPEQVWNAYHALVAMGYDTQLVR